MSVAVKKLDGVEAVTVSLNEGKAAIELRADNSLRLAQLRKAVTDQGFTPKEARVVARGELAEVNGRLEFRVAGTGEVLKVARSSHDPWRAQAGRNLCVTGLVAAPDKAGARDTLHLLAVAKDCPKP